MKKIFLATYILSATVGGLMAQKNADKDPVMAAIMAETNRAKNELRMDGQPPIYFISTFVSDVQSSGCKAYMGKLAHEWFQHSPRRQAVISVSLGDKSVSSALNSQITGQIPVGDDQNAMRIELWKMMDRAYKISLQSYVARANRRGDKLTAQERALPEFVPVPPTVFTHDEGDQKAIDKKRAEDYVVQASKLIAAHDSTISSVASISRQVNTQRVCSSEGSQIKSTAVSYVLSLSLSMQTEKGEPATSYFSKTYTSLDKLPSATELEAQIKARITDLASLYSTKELDAIELACIMVENGSIPGLIDQAKIIGDNTVSSSFQTEKLQQWRGPSSDVIKPALANLQGRRVMSDDITLKAMAGTTVFNGQVLEKSSKMDITGMRVPDSIVVVERGVLRNMITGRKPTAEYTQPTGHLLADNFYQVQSGLGWGVMKMEINPEKLSSREDLYKKMIETTRKRGGRYAYIVGDNNVVRRIDVSDGSIEVLNRNQTWISPPVLKSSSAILGATNDMIVLRGMGLFMPTMIAPSAILFDEMDMKPSPLESSYINTNQRPIVARPQP